MIASSSRNRLLDSIARSLPGARAFGGHISTAVFTINTVIPSRKAARNLLALRNTPFTGDSLRPALRAGSAEFILSEVEGLTPSRSGVPSGE
jgi:hypothetical protein